MTAPTTDEPTTDEQATGEQATGEQATPARALPTSVLRQVGYAADPHGVRLHPGRRARWSPTPSSTW